jgi:hypothetical protein
MEELSRKSEALEASLIQKDSQIGLLRRDRISGQLSRSINLPGTSEIEQMVHTFFLYAINTDWMQHVMFD